MTPRDYASILGIMSHYILGCHLTYRVPCRSIYRTSTTFSCFLGLVRHLSVVTMSFSRVLDKLKRFEKYINI